MMNKEQFLEQLKIKLYKLTPVEIQDILDEYSDNIDNKISEGISEEEAVKDFGNIDDLVNEILEAYNFEPVKNHDLASQIGMIITNIVDYSIKFFQTLFKDLTIEGFARTLVLLGVALIIIAILKIPFSILGLIFEVVTSILLPGFIADFLSVIFNIILGFIHLFISFLIIISFIKVGKGSGKIDIADLINKPLSEGLESAKEIFNTDKNKDNSLKKNHSSQIVYDSKTASYSINNPDDNYESLSDEELEKERKKLQDKLSNVDLEEELEPQRRYGFFTSILVFFIKFFTILFLLPFWCMIIGISICVGFGIWLLISGVSILGLVLIGIGSVGLIGLFVSLISKTVLSTRPNKFKHFKTELIVYSIILGIGIMVSIGEFANFKYVDATYASLAANANTTSTVKVLPINADKEYYFLTDNIIIKESSTLKNEIEINAEHLDTFNLEVHETSDNNYQIYFNSNEHKEFNNFTYAYKYVLSGLKKNIIYNFDSLQAESITVYLPSDYMDNYELINSNTITFK